MNIFLQNVNTKDALTDNDALTNSSSGDELVNQFAKAGVYRNRPIEEVFNDQAKLENYNPELALKFVFYLRMITRNVTDLNGNTFKKVQRGQGNRDESFKRLLWYASYHRETFYDLLYLLPLVGSWKDIFQLAFMLHENSISFNYIKFFDILKFGLASDSHRDLVKKYLPRIRSNQQCKTNWALFTNNFAKDFAKYLRISVQEYRGLKTVGKAHVFQKLICSKDFENLNFNTIPGKALLLLTSGKFIQRHDLSNKLIDWVKTKQTVNFNGYPYELGAKVKQKFNLPLYLKLTIDKQFENLVKVAKMDTDGILSKRNVVSAIDRSGSMEAQVIGDITRMDIAESLGIFFASIQENDFKDWVIKFSEKSKWVKLMGDGFCDKKLSMKWNDCPSNTDAISIIRTIADKRNQYPDISLEDFPNTLLIVSDMQFDNIGSETVREGYERILLEVFPEKWVKDFVVIWWDVRGKKNDYPSTINDGGNYLFSGFDGSIITTLLGGISKNSNTEKPSMLDIIKDTLNQDLLQLVKFSVDIPF